MRTRTVNSSLVILIVGSLWTLHAQSQAPDKLVSLVPESGAVTAPLSVKAGETISFHIVLDKPSNAPRSYLSVGVTGPGPVSNGNSVPLEPGKTIYDVPITISPDAPGGTWRLADVRVGTASGMHSSAIKFDSVSFQVTQEASFDFPSAAKVSINLSQSQLLRREAGNLQTKFQALKAAVSAFPEKKGDARIAKILRQNVLDAEGALEKTEEDFLGLVSTQSQKPTAGIFFGDLHITYQQALEKLKASSDLGPHVQNVAQNTQYPLLADPVFRAFEQNELAYETVADAGALTFDLEVNTIPQGAAVSYRRRGDSFERLQNVTNSAIKALPYAIWFVRFEKTGFETTEREHDPFHEQNHVITVEMHSETKKSAN